MAAPGKPPKIKRLHGHTVDTDLKLAGLWGDGFATQLACFDGDIGTAYECHLFSRYYLMREDYKNRLWKGGNDWCLTCGHGVGFNNKFDAKKQVM